MSRPNKKFKLLFLLFFLTAGFLLAAGAWAQVNTGLEFAAKSGLAATDIRIVIARIIRTVMGFLGVIAVALIVYGGFVWMTAGGNEEKIAQAKKILINAGIGLAIVLASFAIASFVISRLGAATGLGEAGPPGGPAGPPGGALPPDAFMVKSFTPSDDVPIRNIKVRVFFNRNVNPQSAQDNFEVTVFESGSTVEGDITVNGKAIEFEPKAPCPEPNQDRKCFEADTKYKVEVKSGLKSADDKTIVCGGLARECSDIFTTGNLVDVSAPRIALTMPDPGQSVSVDNFVPLEARATDDAGVSMVEFYADGNLVDVDAPDGALPTDYIANVSWDTGGLELLSRHSITAKAFDIDNNSAISQAVEVIARAAHCFNEVKDGGEEDVNCGGDVSAPDYCGACEDKGCADNFDCASGTCDGVCLAPPKILEINPDNGKPGNYISIRGRNFGTGRGTVAFLGADTDGDGLAEDAGAGSDDVFAELADCGGAWKNDIVVIQVPEGAASGPIKLTAANNLSDSTNDFYGPTLADFKINDIARPGICEVTPDSGAPAGIFNISGRQFGETQGKSSLFFGKNTLTPASWSDLTISAKVPDLKPGNNTVAVKVGGEESNKIIFKVSTPSKKTNPRIDYLSPAAGSSGQYVTIAGVRFSSPGAVDFIKSDDPTAITPADFTFPPVCADNYWQDNYIIAKVPAGIDLGEYDIQVTTDKGKKSNSLVFKVNNDPLTPGLCALVPDNGPVDSEVFVYGSGFGKAGDNSKINFWKQVAADKDKTVWSELIRTFVPATAQTGPVEVVNDNGKHSNGLPFAVGACQSDEACGEGKECCGDGSCRDANSCPIDPEASSYSWRFSTGEIPEIPRVVEECDEKSAPPKFPPKFPPSPSPWAGRSGGEDVCRNAAVGVHFNIPINISTFTATREVGEGDAKEKELTNIIIEKCTGAETDSAGNPLNPCFGKGNTTRVFKDISPDPVTEDSSKNVITTSPNGFQINPGTELDPKSWYRVTLKTGIQGKATPSGQPGAFLPPISEQAAARCGYGKDEITDLAYCWTFKTGDQDAICQVGKITVAPSSFTMTEKDSTQRYVATPLAEGDDCLILDSSQYGWDWSISDSSKAGITNSDIDEPAGKVDPKQEVTALAETVPGSPIDVIAEIPSENKEGRGRLTIAFADPVVTRQWPDCQSACPGAAIGAEFNVEMEDSFNNKVILGKCSDESCHDFTTVGITSNYIFNVSGTPKQNKLKIKHTAALEPGAFYRVIIKSDVKSASGKNLTGLNYGRSYSWAFRVKEDASGCELTRVEIVPRHSVLTYIGQTQEFIAEGFGPPDDCDPNGQKLALRDDQGKDIYNWQWTSSKIDVATLEPSNTPPWNGNLLNANPAANSSCSASCLKTGTKAGAAVCGNNTVEKGEDCDDGNTTDGDGCSANCLNEGANSRAVCGDGYIGFAGNDYSYTKYLSDLNKGILGRFLFFGEDCDDGNTTDGDGCSANCLNEGAVVGGSVCGNGVVDPGEDCDDGGTQAGDGCSERCLSEGSNNIYGSTCGNNILEWGESCDDGNTADGDGCSGSCLKEGSPVIACGFKNENECKSAAEYCSWNDLGAVCEYNELCSTFDKQSDCVVKAACHWQASPGGGGICRKSICGDGVVDVSEACDDGNVDAGDGCSGSCLNEGTFAGGGGQCGNGVVGPGEDCDDGNTLSGDGCSSRCLNEGSEPGISVCGNASFVADFNPRTPPFKSTEDGEDCDFGAGNNTAAGCSEQCLNLGAKASACNSFKSEGGCLANADYCEWNTTDNECELKKQNFCDNFNSSNECNNDYCQWNTADSNCELKPNYQQGINDCQIININNDLDTIDKKQDACLREGECRWASGECFKSLCGDDEPDLGEDCDDGNILSGDGCSGSCLNEGSSLSYAGRASICGDGSKDKGEECESGGADSFIDPRQGVRASFKGGISEITATTQSTSPAVSCSGEECAEVEVKCVYKTDQACVDVLAANDPNKNISKIASGANNCCYLRPEVVPPPIPGPNEQDVCRNGLIEVRFNKLIDPASITGNVELWKKNVDSDKQTPLPCGKEPTPLTWFKKIKNFVRNIFVHVGLAQQQEDIWCPVAGNVSDFSATDAGGEFTVVRFTQANLLEPEARYQVLIRGDKQGTDAVEGIRSLGGQVGMYPDSVFKIHYVYLDENKNEQTQDFNGYADVWSFKTGEQVCTLDQIQIDPEEHIFTKPGDNQLFTAAAQSASGKFIQPLANIYAWDWSWDTAKGGDTLIELSTPPSVSSTESVSPKSQNGETELIAAAKITADIINDKSTVDEKITGTALITNQLCENFWSGSEAPDYFTSIDLSAPPLIPEPSTYYNFGSWYCRDNGQLGSDDDLPDLGVDDSGNFNPVIIDNPAEALKELLLKDPDSGDAIGMKILPNPRHLSPLRWYYEQGFAGSPRPRADVGGYPAIEDGNTTYISFANDWCYPNGDRGCIYTNILVVSYNEGASTAIQNIYKQLLDNIKFNTNLEKACSNDGSQSCNADSDCGNGNSCVSPLKNKQKLTRDVKRWADLLDIAGYLEGYQNVFGKYPQLEAGTFLRSLTVSTWPSWNAVLGNALGKSLPLDPKNEFAADCETAGFDKETCWNSTGICSNDSSQSCGIDADCGDGNQCLNRGFYCPSGSKIYWYNARGDGQYNLGANFEYESNLAKWQPWGGGTLLVGGLEPEQADNIGITLGDSALRGYALCAAVNTDNTLQGVCGDGFIDPGEVCDGSGYEDCNSGTGYQSQKYYNCSSDCSNKIYYSDVAHEIAATDVTSALCEQIGACGNGIVEAGENCDDGSRNGQYGYCKSDCSGPGDRCGDNTTQSSYEICDSGGQTTYNTTKTNSCRWDCLDYGPYCGDGVVQSGKGEECEPPGFKESIIDNCSIVDGYQQKKERKCGTDCKWEVDPDNKGCFTSGQCGNGIIEGEEQCDDGKNEADLNNNGIDDGNEDGCNNSCQLTTCGDGIVQEPNGQGRNESCDAGDKNGEPCVPEYGDECAYCGSGCNTVTLTGGSCGNGIIEGPTYSPAGPEECETGANPNGFSTFACVGKTGQENRFWDFNNGSLDGWQEFDSRFTSLSFNREAGNNGTIKISADLSGASAIFDLYKNLSSPAAAAGKRYKLSARVKAANKNSAGKNAGIEIAASGNNWIDRIATEKTSIDNWQPIEAILDIPDGNNKYDGNTPLIRLYIADSCDNCAILFDDVKLEVGDTPEVGSNFSASEVFDFNFNNNSFNDSPGSAWNLQYPKSGSIDTKTKKEGKFIDAEIVDVRSHSADSADNAVKITQKNIKSSEYSLAAVFSNLVANTQTSKYTLKARVKAGNLETATSYGAKAGIAIGDKSQLINLTTWWQPITVVFEPPTDQGTTANADIRMFIKKDGYWCRNCEVIFDSIELFVSGDQPQCANCGRLCDKGGKSCDNSGINSDGDKWADSCDYDDDNDGTPDELDCDIGYSQLNNYDSWTIIDGNQLKKDSTGETYNNLPVIKLTKLTNTALNPISGHSFMHYYAAQNRIIPLSRGQYSFSAWVKAADQNAVGKIAGLLIQREGGTGDGQYMSNNSKVTLTDKWQKVSVNIDFDSCSDCPGQTVGAYIRMFLADGGVNGVNNVIYSALFVPEYVGGGTSIRNPNAVEVCNYDSAAKNIVGDGIDSNCNGKDKDEGVANCIVSEIFINDSGTTTGDSFDFNLTDKKTNNKSYTFSDRGALLLGGTSEGSEGPISPGRYELKVTSKSNNLGTFSFQFSNNIDLLNYSFQNGGTQSALNGDRSFILESGASIILNIKVNPYP